MIDILILGATGFTGRLCTRYLYAHPDRGSKFNFAIGARSKAKLELLVSELSLDRTVEIVHVDVTHPDQIDAAVRKARVIINTVGPFCKWGTPVVAACVRHGIHYVDLTGEHLWMMDIIQQFDYAATKTGSIIIPGSGLDSVPSDIVVHLANSTLKEIVGPTTAIDTSTSAWAMRGGISGGTLGTVLAILEGVPREKLKASGDWALSPVQGLPSPHHRLLYTLPLSSPAVHGAFYFMTPTNRAVVQRTWGLHELDARRTALRMNNNTSASASEIQSLVAEKQRWTYGRQFKYDEFLVMSNAVSAIAFGVVFALGAMALVFIPPVRWLFKKLVPQPGQGPSDEKMEKGHLTVTNITSSVPTDSTPRTFVKTIMRGKGDPGYLCSAVMISESALALLLTPPSSLPALARTGGVLTPMSALGDMLIERLRRTGRFEFESEVVVGAASGEGKKVK
jgi:short subunit dehydrogenase-like uncharacterized protein